MSLLLQVMWLRPMTSLPGSAPRDLGRRYPQLWHMHMISTHWECRYVGENVVCLSPLHSPLASFRISFLSSLHFFLPTPPDFQPPPHSFSFPFYFVPNISLSPFSLLSLSLPFLPLSPSFPQECSLSDKEWTAKVKSTLKSLYNIEYEKVTGQTLWGIRIVLFVKPEHSKKITHLQCTQVRTGIGNVAGE